VERATGTTFLSRRGGSSTYLATIAAPIIWLMSLVANYFLLGQACRSSIEWPLHLVNIAALGVCALAAHHGIRIRDRMGDVDEAEGAGRVERARFVGNLGLMLTSLFSLLILAQWIGVFVFHPCAQA
jgi:hypothetical protein